MEEGDHQLVQSSEDLLRTVLENTPHTWTLKISSGFTWTSDMT